MKKYLIQSIFIVSAITAIAVAESPIANDKQVNTQVSQILLSQQSEVEAAIEKLTLDWKDG